MSETITLHRRISSSRTCVTLGLVDELALVVLFGVSFADRFVKSVYPVKNVIPYQFRLVPILAVHEEWCRAERKESYTSQSNAQDLVLFVARRESE